LQGIPDCHDQSPDDAKSRSPGSTAQPSASIAQTAQPGTPTDFILENELNPSKTTLTLALTAVIGAVGIAHAAGNPFAMQSLSHGYMLAAADDKAMDGKCGADKGKAAEGKCGGDKAKADQAKSKDGKCGTGKCGANATKSKSKAKAAEGKCGGDKAKAAEGKCGADKSAEGKCGGDKAKDGKCGANK
jgi:uncharacterized low-complexity protein